MAITQRGENFPRLAEIMERLLANDGCPWDREQTLHTLKPFLVEEAYEVLEAIEADDPREHCEELGDLLFQIVFQSALRARQGHFGIEDVVDAIAAKMVRRHPHVFSDAKVKDSAEVLTNWGKLKSAEHAEKGKKRRPLDGVPAALPALLRAQRIGEKAATVGFDWPTIEGVREKVTEELSELDRAMAAQDRDEIEHELGDLLFSISRLAVRLGVPPEDALRSAVARFQRRFEWMEDRAAQKKEELGQLSLEALDALWKEAKEDERRNRTAPDQSERSVPKK